MSAGFAPYRGEGAIDRQAYPILFVDDEPDIVETFEIGYGREFRVLTASRSPFWSPISGCRRCRGSS